MPQAELSDLLKGIGQAIKEAQEHIEGHSLTTFSSYFSQELSSESSIDGKEKALRPKMLKLPMPFRGEYIEKEIPIVSMVNHDSLHLDEVRIKMQVTGSWGSKSQDESRKLFVNVEPVQNECEAANGKEVNYAEIELVFKRGNSPEGVAKVLSEQNKTI